MRWTSSISQHYTRFCVETFNYLVLRRLNIGTKLHKSGDTAASLVVCLIIHVSHFTPLPCRSQLTVCQLVRLFYLRSPLQSVVQAVSTTMKASSPQNTQRMGVPHSLGSPWGPEQCSVIRNPPKSQGERFLTNANWPKNVLHGFWYDNYCSVCMLVLTHGAVVTDPLVHGLGDPRLGLHQPGAGPHHRQQPRHLCSGVARLYCS